MRGHPEREDMSQFHSMCSNEGHDLKRVRYLKPITFYYDVAYIGFNTIRVIGRIVIRNYIIKSF